MPGGGGDFRCAAAYPSPERSLELGRQNLHLFRLKNTRFDFIGGALYFLTVVCLHSFCSLTTPRLSFGVVVDTQCLNVLCLAGERAAAVSQHRGNTGCGFIRCGGIAVHEGCSRHLCSHCLGVALVVGSSVRLFPAGYWICPLRWHRGCTRPCTCGRPHAFLGGHGTTVSFQANPPSLQTSLHCHWKQLRGP